eukprot:247097_1
MEEAGTDVSRYGSVQQGSKPIMRAHSDPMATQNLNISIDVLNRSKSVPQRIRHKLDGLNRALSHTFYTPLPATMESVFQAKRATSGALSLQAPVTMDKGEEDVTKRDLNEWKAGLTILNLFVGLGLLSQPYAIRKGGVISLVMLLIITMIASYTGKILVRCFKNMPREMKSYPDIAFTAMGTFGRYLARVAILCDVGLALSIFIVITWKNLIYLSEISLQYEYVIILMVVVAVIPTILLLTFNDLAFISLLGVISAIVLCVVIIINFFLHLEEVKANYNDNQIAIFPADAESFSLCLGIYLFTYGGHAFFAPIYDEMTKKAQGNFEPMVDVSFFIMFFLHGVIGIAGYFPYTSECSVLITHNLLSDVGIAESVLSKVTTALVFVSSFCTISPINSAVCGTLEEWIGIYGDRRKRQFRVAVCLGFCIFSWLLMNKLVILEAMAGAISIMSVTYIIPPICYAIIYSKTLPKWRYYALHLLSACCIGLAIFFTVFNVKAAMNKENNNE